VNGSVFHREPLSQRLAAEIIILTFPQVHGEIVQLHDARTTDSLKGRSSCGRAFAVCVSDRLQRSSGFQRSSHFVSINIDSLIAPHSDWISSAFSTTVGTMRTMGNETVDLDSDIVPNPFPEGVHVE
jgi:hypothetical protein